MKLPEIIRGTPAEQDAKTSVKRLEARINKGARLSTAQQNTLHESKTLSRQLTRRRFLVGAAAFTGAAMVGGGLWAIGQNDEPAPGVIIEPTEEPKINTLEKWRSLSALERLGSLFKNKTPDIESFDPIHEVTLASAQFYCSKLPSRFTPDELAQRTNVVATEDEYIDLLKEHGNLVINDPFLTDEQLKTLVNTFSTAHTSDDKKVYLSIQTMQEQIDEGTRLMPDFAELLRNSNTLLQTISYNLLHEYGHVNETVRKITIPDPINLFFENGNVTITGLEGINISSFFSTDEIVGIQKINSDEALIDSQAFELCRQAGNLLTTVIDNNYTEGRVWINELNTASGVSSTELANYITGEAPIEELLIKWGSLTVNGAENDDFVDKRLNKGLIILAAIGLHGSGTISTDMAYDLIVSQLPVQFGTFPIGSTPAR